MSDALLHVWCQAIVRTNDLVRGVRTNAGWMLFGPLGFLQTQWNMNQNTTIFIKENSVCKIASILSQPQCVMRYEWQVLHGNPPEYELTTHIIYHQFPMYKYCFSTFWPDLHLVESDFSLQSNNAYDTTKCYQIPRIVWYICHLKWL